MWGDERSLQRLTAEGHKQEQSQQQREQDSRSEAVRDQRGWTGTREKFKFYLKVSGSILKEVSQGYGLIFIFKRLCCSILISTKLLRLQILSRENDNSSTDIGGEEASGFSELSRSLSVAHTLLN
jgi:hypothetical protein